MFIHTARRRLTAALALVSLFILPAESLIPDVHDAATHETLAAERSDTASRVVSGHAAVSAATVCNGLASEAGHATHVEHCAHDHGPALAASLTMFIASLDSGDAAFTVVARPPRLAAQPAQRPPIV